MLTIARALSTGRHSQRVDLPCQLRHSGTTQREPRGRQEEWRPHALEGRYYGKGIFCLFVWNMGFVMQVPIFILFVPKCDSLLTSAFGIQMIKGKVEKAKLRTEMANIQTRKASLVSDTFVLALKRVS